MIVIRAESTHDRSAVFAVHAAAFPAHDEARLVDLLRERGKAAVSLVAELDGAIVGHVLFSPVRIAGEPAKPSGLGLAPLAVQPSFQRQGIGSQLVQAGLAACRAVGCPWIVVLGDPQFYGRFGFERASRFGLTNEYGADQAFQVLQLDPAGLSKHEGLVQYAGEFAEILGV